MATEGTERFLQRSAQYFGFVLEHPIDANAVLPDRRGAARFGSGARDADLRVTRDWRRVIAVTPNCRGEVTTEL